MPYIPQKDRPRLRPDVTSASAAEDCGELNYQITTLIRNYLGEHYSYSLFNDVIGVLECAKLELYRRMISPYEDLKRKENGDVY